tara:strand:+ start:42625 stop:43485 length:861 start_codon:yes stop_codon:yes gene_type:complete
MLLLLGCLLLPVALQADTESSLTLSLRHHSNIPNAPDSANRLGDRLFSADYQRTRIFVTEPGAWFSLGLAAGVTALQHTTGMNHIQAGVTAGYSRRLGLGAYAPRLFVDTRLMREHWDGSVRSRWSGQIETTLTKRLSPAWMLSGSLAVHRQDASRRYALQPNPAFDVDVFDQRRHQLVLRADHVLENGQAISMQYRYLDGDLDASARPGTPLLNVTDAIVRDNGINKGYLAYRIDARSHELGVQWNTPLGDNSSVSLGAGQQRASAARGLRYRSNIVHIDYHVRF